ncbi:hypothetical protein RJ640_000461 [Escallonia rubra]|uniref:Uncharacterized protein n=1 Tax=Escallonia rubra TaxID=112253 RepID=A0AA88UC73_9ASTE|nr:hypothetical protein RJ640_000461 [Escallonia rubra]
MASLCGEEERELGRQQAPGACPYCGGKVQAVDVEGRLRFCFLPICLVIKRKYLCTLCSRRMAFTWFKPSRFKPLHLEYLFTIQQESQPTSPRKSAC